MKNGTTAVALASASATTAPTGPINLAMVVQLGVNDYLTVEVFQTSGAALDLDASSTFVLNMPAPWD